MTGGSDVFSDFALTPAPIAFKCVLVCPITIITTGVIMRCTNAIYLDVGGLVRVFHSDLLCHHIARRVKPKANLSKPSALLVSIIMAIPSITASRA